MSTAPVLGGAAATAPAEARKKDRYPNGGNDRYARWQNRRDARRAGSITGVVRKIVRD